MGLRQVCLAALIFYPLASLAQAADPPASNWKLTATAGVRETYDNNVYLQDTANLAGQESMITTVSLSAAAVYTHKGSCDTTLSLGYAPQYAWYHSEPDESHFTHVGTANLLSRSGPWTLDLVNTLTVIDGDDEGLIFLGPGGAPAIGGIPIRDRRDATILRSTYRLAWTSGPWMIRPVFSAYIHDFRTEHSATPGYLNYVDRNDFNGGLDVGYKVAKELYAILGYRYGRQHQPTLLAGNIEYSNLYHRILAGLEGKVTDWLKVAILAGPDFRSFGNNVAPDFNDRDMVAVWVDALVTVTPTASDEATLLVRRYMQPSYGGQAVYEDITYQLTYRRVVTDWLKAQAQLQAYGGEWLDPVTRDDWIYTASLSLSAKINKNLSGELGWSLDRAESKIPDTSGREFTRHLVWAGLKWTF